MKVMNVSVITLEEDKIFLCVWLSAILPIRERRCRDIDQVLLHEIIFFVSVYSAVVKSWAKLLPFGVNCRLQLAGLGKKREETEKPTDLL